MIPHCTIRMNQSQSGVARAPSADPHNKPAESERDQLSRNIEAVLAFYAREEEKISGWQRSLERISLVIGQPAFVGFILLFVALWMIVNIVLHLRGITEFDPAPFFWLQGIVSLGALLTATVVLIKQNRLAKLEEQRAHLDLKVTLLTEQKAAKLIDLLEELRRDLPNVRDRHDPEAATLQQPMDPDGVSAALDERSESVERVKAAGDAKGGAAGKGGLKSEVMHPSKYGVHAQPQPCRKSPTH